MSMIRHPSVYTTTPSRNLVPAAGSAIWYPLHGDFSAGINGLPSLTEIGTPSGSVWGTDLVWTAQTANTTNGGYAVDDENDLYNNSQLSLVGAVTDTDQFITALTASYTVTPSGAAMLWAHGRLSSGASLLGLGLSSGGVPQLHHRAKSQVGGSLVDSLTLGSVTDFEDFKGQGLFALVMSLRMVSASNCEVELRMGNGTLSANYTGTIDVLQLGAGTPGTALPGYPPGYTFSSFGGLTIGHRLSSAGAAEAFWGSNTACVGQIGGFAARKFTTYDADRATDTLASMLARPGEFPRTLCLDYS